MNILLSNWLRIFDVTKLLDDLFAIRRYGRGFKIEWQVTSVWNGAKVERTLNRVGVPTYWRDYGNGTNHRGVHVPSRQAIFADWTLRSKGCAVTSPQLSNVREGATMKEWADTHPSAAHGGVGFAALVRRMFEGMGQR
jgi:hypothetical protein